MSRAAGRFESGGSPSRTDATPASFSARWLALREDFDRRARAAAAPALDVRSLARRLRPDGDPLAVLDLACGSGANLRHLAPRLGGRQRWTLVDHDPALLAVVPVALAAWATAQGFAFARQAGTVRITGPDWQADIDMLRIDLARSLHACPLAPATLVTASALLDLVSRPWIEQLLARVQPAGAAVLFALSVDGRLEWQPALPGDADAARLFAAHQARDKGFGPALGPAATDFTADRLRVLGWHCVRAETDWRIDACEDGPTSDMLRAMIEGIAAAALEQAPDERERIEVWKRLRVASMSSSRLRVGHLDLLAAPPEAAPQPPSGR